MPEVRVAGVCLGGAEGAEQPRGGEVLSGADRGGTGGANCSVEVSQFREVRVQSSPLTRQVCACVRVRGRYPWCLPPRRSGSSF